MIMISFIGRKEISWSYLDSWLVVMMKACSQMFESDLVPTRKFLVMEGMVSYLVIK